MIHKRKSVFLTKFSIILALKNNYLFKYLLKEYKILYLGLLLLIKKLLPKIQSKIVLWQLNLDYTNLV